MGSKVARSIGCLKVQFTGQDRRQCEARQGAKCFTEVRGRCVLGIWGVGSVSLELFVSLHVPVRGALQVRREPAISGSVGSP